MEKEDSNEDLILIENDFEDDKSQIKAQIMQQHHHQANMSNINVGYPQYNPQNSLQHTASPFTAGNTQHNLPQMGTPGGTPEKVGLILKLCLFIFSRK